MKPIVLSCGTAYECVVLTFASPLALSCNKVRLLVFGIFLICSGGQRIRSDIPYSPRVPREVWSVENPLAV